MKRWLRVSFLMTVAGLIPCWQLDAGPLPCINDSLSDYISLGATGCSVGDLVFSNFSFSSTGTSPGDILSVSPSDSGFSPGLSSFVPLLAFDGTYELTSGPGAPSLSVTVGYDVTVSQPNLEIVAIGLQGTALDDGPSASEDVLLQSPCIASVGGPDANPGSSACPATGQSLSVQDEITISTFVFPGDHGTAGNIVNGFAIASTPEPVSFFLAGIGACFLLLSRAKQKRHS